MDCVNSEDISVKRNIKIVCKWNVFLMWHLLLFFTLLSYNLYSYTFPERFLLRSREEEKMVWTNGSLGGIMIYDCVTR